ncbi:MAG: TraE/TraK family type IV conjugative transfer system protein, partial [Aquificaceae bacterium]
LEKENRLFYVATVGLIVANVVLAFLLYRASVHKQVIVIPPKVDKEFWVAGDTLSRAYLEQVAVFLADRILSVSPENVDYSLSMVGPFFTSDPQQLKAIQETLAGYKATIKRENWSQVFYPLKVTITEKAIAVEGIVRKLAGVNYVGQERRTVQFSYEVRNGRLIITEVKLS